MPTTQPYQIGDAGNALAACVNATRSMIAAAAYQMAQVSKMIEASEPFVIVEAMAGGAESAPLLRAILALAEEQHQLCAAIGDATAQAMKRWEGLTSA